MRITLTEADGMAVLRLAGDLRIGSVAEAKPELVAMLATSGELRLDFSELGECDTSGLQLLLMACARARANGQGFATTGHTAAFRAALVRVGIPIECLALDPGALVNGKDDADRR